MSAFGGKADMALCGNSLLRSLLGAKQTWALALHMSAFNPKRISFSLGSVLIQQAFCRDGELRSPQERFLLMNSGPIAASLIQVSNKRGRRRYARVSAVLF
jgi:hypothetical protein